MVIKNEKFSLQIYNENLKILGFSLYYSYSQTPAHLQKLGAKSLPYFSTFRQLSYILSVVLLYVLSVRQKVPKN